MVVVHLLQSPRAVLGNAIRVGLAFPPIVSNSETIRNGLGEVGGIVAGIPLVGNLLGLPEASEDEKAPKPDSGLSYLRWGP